MTLEDFGSAAAERIGSMHAALARLLMRDVVLHSAKTVEKLEQPKSILEITPVSTGSARHRRLLRLLDVAFARQSGRRKGVW